MDVTVVDVGQDGRVLLESGEWIVPTLQEKRAILFAAQQELEAIGEMVEIISRDPAHPSTRSG